MSAASRAGRTSSGNRSTRRRRPRVAATESYPDELKYHREHDWARVEGNEATLGITWFAQDSLGELVHYEPPEPGAEITGGSSYGDAGSVQEAAEGGGPVS